VIHQNLTFTVQRTQLTGKFSADIPLKILCSTEVETYALAQCQTCPDFDAVFKSRSAMDNFELEHEIADSG
jgi:hypothetical protein